MSKYLKPKQEYIDRYDRITVDDCRWRENFHKNFKYSGKDGEKVPEGFDKAVAEIALHYDLLYGTLDWWEKKDATIQKWMSDDEAKDRLLENTRPPEARCLKCLSLIEANFKEVYDWGDDKRMRVLFMYDCTRCKTRRAFFDDGEEFLPKPKPCPKCQAALEHTDERIADEKIVTAYLCPKCGHTDKDELDLSVKKETPDPDYEKDRARFCLTSETAQKPLEEKRQLEGIAQLVDKMKEKEKNQDEYDEIKKIQKLTVIDLEKILAPALEKNGYIRFQFGTPDMGKDLFLPFTAQDSRSERNERESPYELTKLVKKTLQDTNWRLMTDGVSYRVGFLSGRLRAYEREEDLLGLARQRLKKEPTPQ